MLTSYSKQEKIFKKVIDKLKGVYIIIMDVLLRVKNFTGIIVFEDIFADVLDYTQAITELSKVVFFCDGDIIEIERITE